MKTYLAGRFLVAGALMTAPLFLCALPENGSTAAASPAAQTANDKRGNNAAEPEKVSEASQSPGQALSGGIVEILKMMDAKVSPEVIKAYVETTSMASSPSAADIVALKAHAVPDDITTALMKRSAAVREQSRQAGVDSAAQGTAPVAAKPGTAAYTRSYGLDPESYEYFQYYHLHPRTLSSVYQRLSPYYPHSYGYNPPLPYGPYPPGGYSYHHRGFRPAYGPRW